MPIPPDPSGNCNTIPQAIKDTAFREATATIQGQGTESFVYVPNSYNLSSAANGAYCTAKATAKYCPATRIFTWEIRYRTMQPWCGLDWRGASMSCQNGSTYAFQVSQNSERFCGERWYRGNCDGGSSGNPDNAIVAWIRHEGPPPETCANPVTLQVYSSDYPLQ